MKKLIGGFLLLFSIVSGCKQDAAQPKSISDILIEEPDLGMLQAAIKHAGLEDAFKTSSLTLFAPSDEGFKASGFADATAITALPAEQVRALITNHVLTSKLGTETMPLGLNNPIKMMSGSRLFLSNIDGTPYLNQAKGIKSNLLGTNGVVHVINRVIPIPTQSLAQIIKSTPDFSLFWQAARRAVPSDTRLRAILDDTLGRGPIDPTYTVFVPTNQAMIAAKLSQGEINVASPANLARIVAYHIALSRYFSTFLPNATLNMFDASYTTVVENKATGIKVTGRGSPTPPANVTKIDITATNGVIHIIDKVLIP